MDLNKYSRTITKDPSQPASQAMLHAIGLEAADFEKAQIGIACTGWEGNPCNMNLNDLAVQIKKNVADTDLVGLIFNTIGVSDGISMGTDGMRYSLPSRDIIADSIETVVSAQWYDGIIAVVGCDKNMPGAMMAIGRLNRPSILFYGGSIKPGYYREEKLDIVSAFESLGRKISGEISENIFREIIRSACPGAGACGGMYTANTMSSAIEAMGMCLPYNASNPAISTEKESECQRMGKAIRHLLEKNILPRQIMVREAFENAIRTICVLGGSTNAVLHLIAMAKAVQVPLTINDFQEISRRTPFLSDLKPSGQYVMQDLHDIGGVPAVLKLMLKEGLLVGDCLTVTGQTMAQNLEHVDSLEEGQTIVKPVNDPIKTSGHLQILFGNLAPEGAVAKITGKEGEFFRGPAKVFDSERAANEAIEKEMITSGDVVVIRYTGPKGGPGMPEMLKPTSAIMGAGLGKTVALITDGRFSGGSHGFVVGHICPEAYSGGNISLIEDGDIISIDIVHNQINLEVDDIELEKRRNQWQPPKNDAKGILKKYRATVSSASDGCVTDEF